jgi:hypothetical protein
MPGKKKDKKKKKKRKKKKGLGQRNYTGSVALP